MAGGGGDDGYVPQGCSEPSGFDVLNGEVLAVLLGVVTLMGSVLTYFLQRSKERKEQAEAEKQQRVDLDRQQALDRVRKQLSVYVGPLHRLYKTHNTVLAQYKKETGKTSDRLFLALANGGRDHWMQSFVEEYLVPYIADPHSAVAGEYRGMVRHRLKPIYTRIRELVLRHSSDLADMPTQLEWLRRYDEESVTSPYVGSINANVILDTFTVWTLEFDDIIESWNVEDYSRMQPTTRVAWVICNDIVDYLYDEAKAKEARYNKHVKVHRNLLQVWDSVSTGRVGHLPTL